MMRLRLWSIAGALFALCACGQLPGTAGDDQASDGPRMDAAQDMQHTPEQPGPMGPVSGSGSQLNNAGRGPTQNGGGHFGPGGSGSISGSDAPRPAGAKVIFQLQGVQ